MTNSYNHRVPVRATARLSNLLAALTLNLAEDGEAAMEAAAGVKGAAAPALLALDEFLGSAHVGRLADVLGLTHSGAVRLVDQLEREGLVRRRPGADRRRVEIALTSAGRRRAARARRARDQVIEDTIAGLRAEQLNSLEALLDQLVRTRVATRLERRRAGDKGAWWCRTCDFSACGRDAGRCPVRATTTARAVDTAE
jgi:MarR family transcriptional regulator, negative regulator of the multidrug operon emrRAB